MIDVFGIPFTLTVSPFLRPGDVFLYRANPLKMNAQVLVRHESEYALWCSGAKWHPYSGHCPTWTDAAECQCMLGGEV